MKDDYCMKCGNDGFLLKKNNIGTFYREECPCKKSVTIDEIAENHKRVIPVEILEKYVPSPYYKDNFFCIEKFKSSKELPPSLTDIRFDSFLTFAEGLTSLFKSGGLPTKSYIVAAPSSFAKNVFMYSSIQLLLKAERKPSPLLYISDVVDDVKEKGMKIIDNLFREYDIVFVALGVSPRIRDIILFTQILEKANHWGKPVIASSRKHPFELSSYYPNIIEFFQQDTSEKHKYNLATVTGLDYDYLLAYENYIRSQSLMATNDRNGYQNRSANRNNYQNPPQNIQYGFPPNQPQSTLSVAQQKERIRKGEYN